MEYPSKLACLLALALAMAAGIATPCAAQNSTQEYVDRHNAARADVGVGPVSWNDTLAAYAQWYADKRRGDCRLVLSGGQYGENLFWGPASANWTAANAVSCWVSQKQYCSAPVGQSCSLYTQVVWPSTTAIGCARDVCDNDRGVFIICSYYPPSTYGQSATNISC